METYTDDYLRYSEILCVKETGFCHRWMDRVSPQSEDCFTHLPWFIITPSNSALSVQSFLTCFKLEKPRLSLD